MATASSDANAAEKLPLEPTIAPQLYIKANNYQRSTNIKVLDSPQISFATKPNPSQQFIDLGCGTGDFTLQELLPRCQPCRRIVATDVSRDMVEYAKENFTHAQIAYEVRDVESDISGLVEKYGKFDRVYSFYVLHWVQDLTAALRNVADLMTDEGECLLVFPARLGLYKIWRKLVEMDRWKPYKGVIERFIPPSQDIKGRSGLNSYILNVLETANLKPLTCQVLTQDRTGMNMDQFIQLEVSLNPILPLLSEVSKMKFKTDMADVIRKLWTQEPAGDTQYHTDIFVVHANKISKSA
ncbi:juvenile hormone acid O-methyltransferase-like [Ixodes scapularis]|uniref:juvenile hormone acid O-methyltransferase-like n=1 Tax=Ixodes scapularis TaxID=6945 RepID=UPI001A9DFE8E|nr:juvenile hormone acid O-methyltransferase-like [Ixodes scapularis]